MRRRLSAWGSTISLPQFLGSMFSYQKFLPAVLASRALHEDVIHRREDRRRLVTIRASKSVFSERGNLFGRGLTGLLYHPIERIKSAKATGLEQFRAAVDVGRRQRQFPVTFVYETNHHSPRTASSNSSSRVCSAITSTVGWKRKQVAAD